MMGLTFVDLVLIGIGVLGFIGMRYYAVRYYEARDARDGLEQKYRDEFAAHIESKATVKALRNDCKELHQEIDTLHGDIALELHRNNVLADRAEIAEKKLAFSEKQIDALLLLPQSRCSDGALRRPTVAVIRDEGQA